ncbi:epithelial-stromal interaction protein 1 [Solea solea]|uniref:epithelial-stromal interaction protein 1 n=1 Tax=Solea solea TaxID=90069 RepID=UPI00272C0BDE|nr:epithelial-stromal interaction protein 1 [Solea solea]
MDPQRNHVTRDDLRSETPPSSSPSSSSGQTTAGQTASDPRQPRYSDGYTVIPPKESQRRALLATAQKEEENRQRWTEENRVTHVHMEPETLGGHMTQAEVRQQQQTNQHTSKWQKKLMREEQERTRRQEEEKELQKMKDEQRNKSERLQERRQQEDQKRKQDLTQDHSRRQESFLQRVERTKIPVPLASSTATHTSSTSESVEIKPKKSSSEVQLHHKRVNSAFLDRIEGRGSGVQKAEPPCLSYADLPQPSSSLIGPQSGSTHLDAEPEQNRTQEQETELYLDYDFVLRRLMSDFPQCNRKFLEDMINQCHGDYERIHSLLS